MEIKYTLKWSVCCLLLGLLVGRTSVLTEPIQLSGADMVDFQKITQSNKKR
jgi:hypothetical protein